MRSTFLLAMTTFAMLHVAIVQAADKTSSATCTIFESSGWETLVSSEGNGELWAMGADPSIVGTIETLAGNSFKLNVAAYGTRDELSFSADTSTVLKNSRLSVSCKVR